MFARLPYFCVTDILPVEYGFQLSFEERTYIESEFRPLLITPHFFEPDAPVRHIFCETDIEDALLKKRHVCYELSSITNRRVVMTTQALVERLIIIKKMLLEHKNYEVCFLSDGIFTQLTMQIACFGDEAAIGWIPKGKSTACRDYTNVNALTGFCEAIWNKIPGIMRQRRNALRKLNTFLKKAAMYGYDVRE